MELWTGGLFTGTFGRMDTRLKKIRLKRKETKYKVSKYTKIPYSTLTRLEEREGDTVNLVQLKELCAYYGVEFDVRHLLNY